MPDQNASRCGGTGATPADGITVTLKPNQVDYLRELVFEDLKDWAADLCDKAQGAGETQGRDIDASDAMEFCRPEVVRDGLRPHMATLDALGWEHPEHHGWRMAKIAEYEARRDEGEVS